MNTTEKLLSDMLKILAELQKQNGVKPDVDRNSDIPTEPKERWKPKDSEQYGYIDSDSNWFKNTWSDSEYDNHRYDTGNCYPPHEKELAIWEQVTRRKHKTALWDAADWDSNGYFQGGWDIELKKITTCETPAYLVKYCCGTLYDDPKFATEQSAIEAHKRILGDDAERYFKGRG